MVSAALPPGEIATGHYMALAMTISMAYPYTMDS